MLNVRGANTRVLDVRGANTSVLDVRGANTSVLDVRGANTSVLDVRGANTSVLDVRGEDTGMRAVIGTSVMRVRGRTQFFVCVREPFSWTSVGVHQYLRAVVHGYQLIGCQGYTP